MDAEFRSLVRQASDVDRTGVAPSSEAFVASVRALEALIDGKEAKREPSLEQLREDVERKKILLEKHKGDLGRWKSELETAVDKAERVLLGKQE